MRVYLAGGMRSGWQDKVKKLTEKYFTFSFYDPRDKEYDGKPTLIEYGTWDLHYIKRCDIVFAYMERTNPSGVGMACELGYAFAMGKTVILVLEEGNESQKDRYLQFMKKVSTITYDNLEDAIKYLASFTV